MRTLCDVCESAAAILFCAADEAALCRACDDKVHMCNKLASRHLRVGLAEPSKVPCCDICENAPAYFYCEVDGSSLCLHCDLIVHVGGKRTHRRFLLLRQRAEFPGDKPENLDEAGSVRGNLGRSKYDATHASLKAEENLHNHQVSPNPIIISNIDSNGKMVDKLIDLNMKPQRMHEHTSNNQDRASNLADNNHEPENMVPGGFFEREHQNGEVRDTPH